MRTDTLDDLCHELAELRKQFIKDRRYSLSAAELRGLEFNKFCHLAADTIKKANERIRGCHFPRCAE